MPAQTYFGNRATCKVLNTWTAGSYTFTTGSTTFTGTASAGDYVWAEADGIQHACKVASAGTLTYAYRGAGGVGVNGYRCTPETLQVLRGLEMTISWEIEELFGTDSTMRVDEARHHFRVEAKARYCKWNCDPTVDWAASVLNPTSGGGTVEDTNTCFVNGVVYTIKGSAGTYIEFVCGKTYWKNIPWPFPENDFIIRDVTGNATSATAHSY